MDEAKDDMLLGYATPWALHTGQQLTVHVSTPQVGNYDASLVRLWSGDSRPKGTGFRDEPVAADFAGTYRGRPQALRPGSYAQIDAIPRLSNCTLGLCLLPTMAHRDSCILSAPGLTLCTRSGALWLTLHTGDGDVDLGCSRLLRSDRWHEVRVDLRAERATLAVRALALGSGEQDEREQVEIPLSADMSIAAGTWSLAARLDDKLQPREHFNGRLEALRIYGSAVADADLFAQALVHAGDLIAGWNFAREPSSQKLLDDGPQALHGRLLQTPTRAVPGRWWDGSVQSVHDAPHHYAAIHFHADDLTDAGWDAAFSWTVAEELASGVYAIKLSDGDQVDYVPFFVTNRPGQRTAPVAFLAPTATYLAYANQRLGLTGGDIFSSKPPSNPYDRYLLAHPEVGYSLYEHHEDGSGVHFSSARRPVLNFKPHTVPWAFTADTNLTAWLGAIDQPFDVISDQDLHRHGSAALEGYAAVITGTHPEYHSTNMLQGLEDYLDTGGRLMYMGGNGFYWRIAFNPEDDQMLEVRRAEDGTRAWIAQPGAYYHQWGGEYGGLWRRLGRPPNQMVGIGFAAQGFDGGTYYRIKPAAQDDRVAFMFEGVDTQARFGDYGTQGGGAAGEEIDRFDISLGSPGHALVVATSENHRPGMLRVKEEFHMTRPLENDAKVRADMTFFETPSGGAVFATGSISYAGSLAHNNYDNDVARLTGNVLRRFLDPQPFEFPST